MFRKRKLRKDEPRTRLTHWLLDIVKPIYLDITQDDIGAAMLEDPCPANRAAKRQFGERSFVGRQVVFPRTTDGDHVPGWDGRKALETFTSTFDDWAKGKRKRPGQPVQPQRIKLYRRVTV